MELETSSGWFGPFNELRSTEIVVDVEIGLMAASGCCSTVRLEELLDLVPPSVIDGEGAQHIRWGQSSPIRLVFWVELGPMPMYVVGSSGPRPEGLTARRYNELGQILLCTLTSGIGVHRQKNLKNLMNHMVMAEPVNVI